MQASWLTRGSHPALIRDPALNLAHRDEGAQRGAGLSLHDGGGSSSSACCLGGDDYVIPRIDSRKNSHHIAPAMTNAAFPVSAAPTAAQALQVGGASSWWSAARAVGLVLVGAGFGLALALSLP